MSGIVLVTGGASGIGLATAKVLAARGWRPVLADRDADGAREASEALGAGADWIGLDVRDAAAVEAAVAEIERRHGPLAALFANAGLIQKPLPPEDYALDAFDDMIATNLRGVYVCCLAAGRRMAVRGRGAIVITGSITASRAMPLHAYAPAKAAVVHMAGCLAAEWGRSGVRVNAVSPGFVATPPIAAAIRRGERDRARLSEGAALGRLVEAEEVGRAVAFLLSEEASAITGIDLPVDAGWLAASHLGSYNGVRSARVAAAEV